MGIKVATPDSPKRRRAAWLTGAGLGVSIGLFLAIGSLTSVTSWEGLAFSMLLVIPGLVFVLTGAKVILRVSGKRPNVRVRSLSVFAFSITAALASFSTVGSLFFYALSKSVIAHEGGQPTSDPENILIATAILALITFGAFVFAIVSTRIDDPPRLGRGR